jgi:predicted alpha/beta hydrolase family esterase
MIPLSSSAGQVRQWHQRLKAQMERAEVPPILGDIAAASLGSSLLIKAIRRFGDNSTE